MINFIIFIECLVFAEMLLLLIFGPNFFDYFFLSIFILILTIPALFMLLVLIIAAIQNPILILTSYILLKFLPSL
jgi:hypothetical protein